MGFKDIITEEQIYITEEQIQVGVKDIITEEQIYITKEQINLLKFPIPIMNYLSRINNSIFPTF